jgi:hypothetical protein
MKSISTQLVNSTRNEYTYIGDYTQESLGETLKKLEQLYKWDLRKDHIYIFHSPNKGALIRVQI